MEGIDATNKNSGINATLDRYGGGSGGSSFRTVIVDTTEYVTIGDFIKRAVGENGVIYLYPNSNHYGENTYTELLWVEDDSKFEIIDRDITIDSTPTSESPNPISSGGVYTALQGKADNIYVDTVPQDGLVANTLYRYGVLSQDTTFTLAAATDNTIVNVWMWTFQTGKNPPTINWPQGVSFAGNITPIIDANTYYEVTVMDNVLTCIKTESQGGGE